jgi:hypothetical protein
VSEPAGELPQLLEGRAAFAARALELVQAAHGELLLLSDSLERGVYGSEAFAEAIKGFLLRNERVRLKVLVSQPQPAARNIPQLLELARRVSSRVEFRQPAETQGEPSRCEWLIADRRVLLERREPESLESQFWAQAPQRGKTRGEEFEALWNEAIPAQELRSLGI